MARLAFICENCGYSLQGLAHDRACPECGVPARLSHPSFRPGSAWQRDPSLRGWLRSSWDSIRRPRTRWREVQVEVKRSLALLVVTTLVASALAAGSLLVPNGQVRGGANLRYVLMGFFPAMWGTLMILSEIESLGVRFFGRRRGWRITRGVAAAICAHASVGWLVGSMLFVVVWGAAPVFLDFLDPLIPGDSAHTVFFGLLVGALFLGLVWFETLVFLGFRAMRFANPPDVEGLPEAPQPPQ